jgi:nucleoside-diphosphate-sugar epimerase
VRSGKKLPAGVVAVEGDILDPASLASALLDVSVIIHLAAVFRTRDDELIWKVNLEGTRNLISAVKTYASSARFIMASTSNIYNMDGTHPGREDDVADPKLAYPASKLEAEKELRASGLKWSILRFPFVYGDGDGHLEDLPKHVVGKWHPAQRMSTIHHRDIATAMKMALEGVMDGRIVNITDEAPTSVYELLSLVGTTMESSSQPLTNPWYLHVDGTLARSLGFRPTVRTVYQAAQQKLL